MENINYLSKDSIRLEDFFQNEEDKMASKKIFEFFAQVKKFFFFQFFQQICS